VFNSDVLEVGIGMVLLFSFMSLIATALCEAIENFAKLRSKELLAGVKELLEGGAEGEVGQFVSRFYEHPVIASLYSGTFDGKTAHLPSYIPRKSFSLALVDMIAKAGGSEALSAATLRQSLESSAVPDRVKEVVKAALDTSGDNLAATRRTLEECFDATMDRVSGWYKRHTGYRLLVIGAIAAVGLNVDALVVAQRLTTDNVLREAVVERAGIIAAEQQAAANASADQDQANASAAVPDPAPAGAAAGSPDPKAGQTSTSQSEGDSAAPSQEVKTLANKLRDIGYPIGWTLENGRLTPRMCVHAGEKDPWRCGDLAFSILLSLPGWIMTALAIMLGAPFWFDLLNKFMIIRSTVKPREKSPDEPALDAGAHKS
jgi:hypothetical protein